MRSLTLDFQAPLRRFHGIGIGLLVLSLILAGAAIRYQSRLNQEVVRVEGHLSELERRMPGKLSNKAKTKPDKNQQILQRNTQIALQLVLPWEDLFNAIEQADQKEVALLQMQPYLTKEQLRLVGEAKTMQAVLNYIRRLEQTPQLTEVHLLNHEINQKDRERPIRFTLTARWLQKAGS